jgi:hypothetical protein
MSFGCLFSQFFSNDFYPADFFLVVFFLKNHPLPLPIAIARRPLPVGHCLSAIARRPLPIGHCPSAVA